ncbi:hypothetical protein V1264_003533 [Littorina saxatilis]
MACERLNESSAKKLLAGADSFLFDCDGVLWDGRGVIPGSLETIKKLKALGKKVFYVTNNSSKTRDGYLQKAKQFGFPATVDEIVCTAYIAALYLKNKQFKGKVFVVGNTAMGQELDAVGIAHTGIGPAPTVGGIPDWVDLKWDSDIKCVLVGFDADISYMKILRAASYLQRPECLFVGTNEDTHLPVNNSATRIPGTGTMVIAVAFPAQRKPVIVGKPEPPMFEELKKLHNLNSDRCVMVGDRLESDIGLAKSCGLKSMLVLSGVTSEAELPKPNPAQATGSDIPVVPDFYTNCLGDLGKFI